MLQRIKDLVKALVCKAQAKAPKQATPQLREFTTMRATNQVANIGGIDHQVYLAHGSKQAHVLMGSTFVPLSILRGGQRS